MIPDVLIVGAGMYVCGKGTDGYGTILPAIIEAYRTGLVGSIHICCQSASSAENARQKGAELCKLMKLQPKIFVHHEDGSSTEPVYMRVIEQSENPMIGIVSVPDHLHCEVACQLMAEGLHTQVVKPLCPSIEENQRLIQTQEENQVLGMVEFHKRLDEANLKLLDQLELGKLGELHSFDIQYSQRKIIPTVIFRSWVEHTDIFQYLGVHYVDLIHFLTQASPIRVMAIPSYGFLRDEGIDTPDCIRTLIEWKESSGHLFHSSHLTGWIDPNSTTAMSDQRIEVVGSKGRYQSNQKDRGVTLATDTGGVEQINPYFSQFYYDPELGGRRVRGYGVESIIRFVRDSIQVISGQKETKDFNLHRPTFSSQLPISAVIEANRESYTHNSSWVDVKSDSTRSL